MTHSFHRVSDSIIVRLRASASGTFVSARMSTMGSPPSGLCLSVTATDRTPGTVPSLYYTSCNRLPIQNFRRQSRGEALLGINDIVG